MNSEAQIKQKISDFKLDVVCFALTASFSILIVVFYFKLWKFHPNIPIEYQGDGILTMSAFRNMQLGNWYFTTRQLGFPFGQQLFDFPAIADGLNLLMAWVGIHIGLSPAYVFNSIYFLGFILAACFGFMGARILKLDRPISILIGLLFAFLPFHTLQGPGHLFLSLYFSIPIWISTLLRQVTSDPIFKSLPNIRESGIFGFVKTKTFVFMALIGVIGAASGIYYAAFMLLTALFIFLLTFSKQNFRPARATIAVTVASSFLTLAIQAIPVVRFQMNNGRNTSSVSRTIHEIEYYSLRLIDLLLPIVQHRLEMFSEFSTKNVSAYIPGEPTESLGILGVVGLLIMLLTVLIFNSRENLHREIVVNSSLLAFFMILFATTGGISQLIASIGLTEIRVWSRISIVIGYLSLLVVGHALMSIRRKFFSKFVLGFPILLICIGCISFLDTNPPYDSKLYEQVASDWNRDKALIHTVEQSISPNAAIFQFPIMQFPENGPVESLSDYQHMRGYLHSSTLCWSYGAMKGREGVWLDSVSKMPINDALHEIKLKGFDVIWVDKAGYSDQGTEIIRSLSQKIGGPVLTDQLKNVVIFRLNNNVRSQCKP